MEFIRVSDHLAEYLVNRGHHRLWPFESVFFGQPCGNGKWAHLGSNGSVLGLLYLALEI